MKNIKKPRSTEMWITIGIFGAVFAALIVYINVYVKNNQQELISNSYNSRQKILATENTRGDIYDRDGELLATTKTGGDNKEYRYYPYENLYAHAIGYSTKGKTAVEVAANYYLINSNIAIPKKVENDVAGRKNPGNNVYTTFDTKLQQVCYDSLGAFRGAVIVSNVKTGEILAMVSKPDYNPNTIVEDWDKYTSDSASTVLLNRVTSGLYPPGSTFKIVTALEYLREHPNDYEDYSYSCNGHFKKDDINIQCYHGMSHGQVDFREAFKKSCNCSFINMGLSLDRVSYGETLNGLLFNQNLPLDYNYAVCKTSVDALTTDEQMAQIAFGQGKASVTPMIMNLITNAIANKGMLMKPYEISKVVDADGNTVEEWYPESYERLMTEEEASILADYMSAVTEEGGTGSKLRNSNYTAAGKTGSADFNKNIADSHSWFTGFAPVEDPEISVTIIVEEVGSSSDYAVPYAKRIFDCYFGVQ